MTGLRVKLAIGVAVLGVVVTAAAAVAGSHNRLEATLTGLRGGPGDLNRRPRDVPGRDHGRRQRDPLRAALRPALSSRPAGAHPLRPEVGQRRDLRLPVHEPGQRPGRHAGVPGAARPRHRHDPRGRRGRTDRPGDRGGRAATSSSPRCARASRTRTSTASSIRPGRSAARSRTTAATAEPAQRTVTVRASSVRLPAASVAASRTERRTRRCCARSRLAAGRLSFSVSAQRSVALGRRRARHRPLHVQLAPHGLAGAERRDQADRLGARGPQRQSAAGDRPARRLALHADLR